MSRVDYFRIGIAEAAEECGLEITEEQLNHLASAVAGGASEIGQVFPEPESAQELVVRKLKKELQKERDKIICPECRGQGSITEFFCGWRSTSQCDICRGEGKVSR